MRFKSSSFWPSCMRAPRALFARPRVRGPAAGPPVSPAARLSGSDVDRPDQRGEFTAACLLFSAFFRPQLVGNAQTGDRLQWHRTVTKSPHGRSGCFDFIFIFNYEPKHSEVQFFIPLSSRSFPSLRCAKNRRRQRRFSIPQLYNVSSDIWSI